MVPTTSLTRCPPYGTATFRHEPSFLTEVFFRFIEATDPLGATEHLEVQQANPELSASEPAGEVPTGSADWNRRLNEGNTLY